MNATTKRLFLTGEFNFEAAKLGLYNGVNVIRKFGAGELDTTMHAVTSSQTYYTPIAAVSLEAVSDDAQDNPAGTGAYSMHIEGLDADWNEVHLDVELNGLTPVALPSDLIRLYRFWVDGSGTYATMDAGSHAGSITFREIATPANIWGILPKTPFPVGQSQVGVYTVAKGKTAYLISKNIFVDSLKAADIYFFQRPDADSVSGAPYAGIMRLVEREVGVQGGYALTPSLAGPFVGPCDVGFMGVIGVGTAECSVEFELLVIDD